MRAIEDHDELVSLCEADTLCLWAAQGPDGNSRAWASDDGRALAVAGPGLSLRDRLVVRGPIEAAVPLTRSVLAEVGPTYRPLGDPELIDSIVGGVPEMVRGKAFGWMEFAAPAGPAPPAGPARWLSDAEMTEATALLKAAFPTSNAMPGVPGVESWAGVRDDAGRLAALAALAWSAPTVGLIAGVAVRPGVRGRGLGRVVCAFILAAALDRHGSAGLMVDEWNTPAIRLYRRLGLRYRPVLAAHAPS
jgi:GNAT superfamily N-acetyltransferase